MRYRRLGVHTYFFSALFCNLNIVEDEFAFDAILFRRVAGGGGRLNI